MRTIRNRHTDLSTVKPQVSYKPPAGFHLPIYTVSRVVGKKVKIKIDPDAEKDEIREIMSKIRKPEVRITHHVAHCSGRFVSDDGREIIKIGDDWKLYDPRGKFVRAGKSPEEAVSGIIIPAAETKAKLNLPKTPGSRPAPRK